MAFDDRYRRQVALLVRALPHVNEETCFALKGGTAINLFIRNMPRLSVDIDLTYLPVEPRQKSLTAVDAAMTRIGERIKAQTPGVKIAPSYHDGHINKLLVRADDAQIKIEVTPVLRGCVYEPELRAVSEAVESAFGFAEANVVSFADLYAGKIVAALDRQHPRDLFDVRDLLANEGIDDALRRAFIVYLLSHNRPMHEVLVCLPKDLNKPFKADFDGMTDKPVSVAALVGAREALVKEIRGKMSDAHRRFLLSFEKGEPNWSLLGIKGVESLPAVKWRQQNLDKLPDKKRLALVEELEAVLNERGPKTK